MAIFSGLKEFFCKLSSGLKSKLWDKQRSLFLFLFFAVTTGGVFLFLRPAYAVDTGSWIADALCWLLEALTYFFGRILLFFVDQLISLATYNKFVVSTAVVNGWVIVRDLCNMFFIVVLLIIAIATILKVEMYSYKKLLGRVVIMAILINFSKTVCGIVIDFAQVLTLTFVNGFKAAAGGNFIQALKLDQIFKINPGGGGLLTGGTWEIVLGYILALLMTVISCVVVGVMLVVFLIRIVMLWILIVLSPLAFFLSTFPQGQKYASQWWSQFGNYVIVGPVMAFFLWLSLISVTTLSANDKPDPLPGSAENPLQVTETAVGTRDNLQGFIIAIGMLVGGLMITQQMGVMGSSLAGSAVGAMKKYGMGALKWTAKKPFQAYGLGARKLKAATGLDLNPVSVYKNLRTGFERKKQEDERMGMIKAGERMSKGGIWGAVSGVGAAGWVDNYAQGWFYNKGIKSALIGRTGRVNRMHAKSEAAEKKAQDLEEGWAAPQLGQAEAAMRQSRIDTHAAGQNFTGADGKEYSGADVDALLAANGIAPGTPAADNWLKDNFDKPLAEKFLRESFSQSTGPEAQEARKQQAKAEKYKEKELTAAAFKPEDYVARAERRSEWDKEAKKHVTTNEDELVAALQKAIAKNDPEEAAGVLLHAARVGHGNEVVQGVRSDRDWYFDEKDGYNDKKVGRKLYEKGDYFDASQEGLSCMIDQVMVDKLGLGKQVAYSLQNDLSNEMEKIHHWFAGQSISQEADGTYRQRSPDEQQVRVAVEKSKRDFEDLYRRQNRLGMGSERFIDRKDPRKGKMAVLNPESIAAIRRDWKQIAERLLKGGRMNKNAAMHMVMPHNMKILEEIKTKLDPGDQAAFQTEFIERMKAVAGKAAAEAKEGFGKMIKDEIDSAKTLKMAAGV